MEICLYNIQTTSALTSLEPEVILQYCKIGLVETRTEAGEPHFTDEGVYLLRQIEFLRLEKGINLDGIAIIFDLMRELNNLRAELRFQREHLPT